ncbi:galactofuranosylgalactofuranosylrhamnosyl-N-acetylglucosaminyl-diphospho-decaprenol beta-1,5/1,6-galactofuranosyltransferase [Allokutzneria albata]|uniref:Galactofuranosylgalactofuranosylrhamnosyl-N-acetylglucosaminyl-diphospho-decaprenol beta-1,5/1,6-galactofuranosyltransferase n=2 Tax=Allokutzneria albata TaxID=211114 RepID=A0A1G9Y6Q0_ALLAB|nr:galactofuranosylgalactofuranosylrhamnosyl-N-acetylglucosaminyl-diphospho-decaprenol beta-1,5/1,6-galactofuranosyltransferase [Allokutzneria albata]
MSDPFSVPSEQVLQRVIFPRDEDPLDVRALYIDEIDEESATSDNFNVLSRTSGGIPPRRKVSFASYFNAFPASYWKRWTRLDEVILRLSVKGTGRLDVYRSKPNGDSVHLQGTHIASPDKWCSLEFCLSLKPFEDGGWIWFDAVSNDTTLLIDQAAWTTDIDLPRQTVVVGATTTRPVDCVAMLLTLAEDPQVMDIVDRVVIPDQGAQRLRNTKGFAEAASKLGDKLRIIEQGNLGGSGGFARVMYEGVYESTAEQILILDDDIALEPDSVLRVNAFARAASHPVIVGAHMLNLQARSRLHTMGEVVDLKVAMWRAAPSAVTDHDFAEKPLRKTKDLHKRIDADYNGWWMCLFPREIIEKIGLPLPLFIKHEDSEYSLRAAAHDFPTVSLPGAAIWHMPWTDKNDATDWTIYFHVRNRMILAALHSPEQVKSAIIQQMLKLTLRHLLSMEYSTVALQLKAVDDFMAGPDRLFDSLRTKLPEVQELRKNYSDAQIVPSSREFPPPSASSVMAEGLLKPPTSPAVIAVRAVKALLHNLKEPAQEALERPQLNVPAANALWFLLGNLDSATVSTADGSGVTFRHRDPEEFRRLGLRALNTYRKLSQEWPRLRRSYLAAQPTLVSPESWKKLYQSTGTM